MLRATLAALLLALPALASAQTALMTRPDKLRDTPSSFAFGIAEVHRRSSVQVLEVRGEWVRVEISGNRTGWIQRDSTDLGSAPPENSASPAPSSPLRSGSSAALPRSAARASNHALILSLTPSDPKADASSAGRIAALMGVPDTNTRYLAALSLDGLRQALAELDARIGDQDRVFIHIAAFGARPRSGADCGDAILSDDKQLFTATELHRYLQGLAARTDKVFVVIDAGRGDERKPTTAVHSRFSRQPVADGACSSESFGQAGTPLPANVQILLAAPRNRAAFEDGNGGLATQALLACLEGRAPTPGNSGLADGDALRRCAQPLLDRKPGEQQLALAGNPALIPAPFSWTSDPTGTDAPRRSLEAIHAQRDQRRRFDARPAGRATAAGTPMQITSDRPGHLYVLMAGDGGLSLLYPNQYSPDTRLEPGARISLLPPEGRKSLAGSRLLFLLTDGPRTPYRGGFAPTGAISATHPDARGLRSATEEFLGGDVAPQCRFSETRNLGATQARQCSSAFAARWITAP
ncbi:caspase family protein [Zoogloea sp.]|uniref:caspase family protein n=1 Tax=Zoogloea sp. TaxID=49181 RepID=UPI0025F950DD|nr:caspase family protein [Zoogloea sp.]MCK6396256.1 caspase family protein [Zoogloea sp.]